MRLVVLDGVRYLLDCSQDYFHLVLPAVKADIQLMKDTQLSEQKWFSREDKWDIIEQYGLVTVRIAKPKEEHVEEIEKVREVITRVFPVLGISLTTIVYPPDRQGDKYAQSTDPVPGNWMYMSKEDSYLSFAQYEHVRLEEIGTSDNQWDESDQVDNYPQVEHDILFSHEFAYRKVWDAFGNYAWIDPVIFTCGNYVPQLPTLLPLLSDWERYEYYSDKDRAKSYDTIETTTVIADGRIVATGSLEIRRPYKLTFVENYIIPDDLILDGWPEEMRNRCCHPPGTYKVYDRAMEDIYATGTEVAHVCGAGTEDGKFSACLVSHYVYSGDASNYEYELRLHVSGWSGIKNSDFLVHSGGTGSDDLYCYDFRLFNFDGIPVPVFGIIFYPDDEDPYFLYGIYFADQLYLTERFTNDKGPLAGNWNRHDLYNSREELGLEGYGGVWAFGIKVTEQL